MHADDYPSCWATSMDDQVYVITEDRHNHLTLNILLHTQTYIYVKIAKRTVMALLQQPTEERMVSTFLTACLWYQHCFTGSLRVINSSSQRSSSTWESKISPTFEGFSCISLTFLKILNFPDTAQNSLTLNFPDFSLTSGNHVIAILYNSSHKSCNQPQEGKKT